MCHFCFLFSSYFEMSGNNRTKKYLRISNMVVIGDFREFSFSGRLETKRQIEMDLVGSRKGDGCRNQSGQSSIDSVFRKFILKKRKERSNWKREVNLKKILLKKI